MAEPNWVDLQRHIAQLEDDIATLQARRAELFKQSNAVWGQMTKAARKDALDKATAPSRVRRVPVVRASKET